MLRSYLKITLRVFKRNPIYGLLNIAGFSIGMGVCLALLIWVYNEWSYDRHQPDGERVYRIHRMWKNAQGEKTGEFCSLAPSFTLLLKTIPEIERIARIAGGWNMEVKKEDETSFLESQFYYAEQDIFDILEIKLISGDQRTSLASANSMILSHEMANKYFQGDDPIGQSLVVNEKELIITGVFDISDKRTHLDFDFIASYVSLRDHDSPLEDDYFLGDKNFSENVTFTYAKLTKGTSIEQINEKIGLVLNARFDDRTKSDGSVVSPNEYTLFNYLNVRDIHLFSKTLNEYKAGGDMDFVILFLVIAILVMVLASVNFINLSVARSMKRVLEVSVRKALGANRRRLIHQFMMEAVSYTVVSIILAIAFVKTLSVFAPWIPIVDQPAIVLIFGSLLFLIIGLFSGIYPSIYLSRYQALGSSKNAMGSSGSRLRGILLGLQFVITISMIIGLITVGQQIHFLQQYDLGYSSDGVITIPLREGMQENWHVIKSKLEDHDRVNAAARSKRTPTEGLWDAPGFDLSYNGKNFGRKDFSLPHVRVGFGFLNTYEIDFVAGRNFDRTITSDLSLAYILNESALKNIGIDQPQDAIGIKVKVPGREDGQVIGVVKDFNYESLRSQISPIIIYLAPNQANTASIRLGTENLSSNLQFVEETIGEFVPDFELEPTFLDEKIRQLYENESTMMRMLSAFTMIAIIISCLGLIGLTLLISESRKKEVAVRKVMGAPVLSILRLMSNSFMRAIIVANVFAWPITWYILGKWLDTYAYAAKMNVFIFIVAGLSMMFLAMSVMWIQVYNAANANPIVALREE